MKHIEIEKVPFSDIDRLQEIAIQTFKDTFGHVNSPVFMEEYLRASFSKEKLKTELLDPESAVFFAKMDKQVVGYLKVNFGQAQTEIKDDTALEIERIYVTKEFLGKKIGQALYEHALNIAQNRKLKYVWLGVWEENSRAIRFYERNGFEIFGDHTFDLGGDKQTDILMKKILP